MLTDKFVVIEPARNIADSLFVVEHIHRKDYQLMVNVLVELNLIEKNEKIDTAIWKNICVHYSLEDRLREFVYDSLKNKEGVLKSDDVYFMNRQQEGYLHFNIETYKTFLKSNSRTAKSKQDFSSAKMLSYPYFSKSRNAMLVCVKNLITRIAPLNLLLTSCLKGRKNGLTIFLMQFIAIGLILKLIPIQFFETSITFHTLP